MPESLRAPDWARNGTVRFTEQFPGPIGVDPRTNHPLPKWLRNFLRVARAKSSFLTSIELVGSNAEQIRVGSTGQAEYASPSFERQMPRVRAGSKQSSRDAGMTAIGLRSLLLRALAVDRGTIGK